ncbi:VOC family protein [Niveibacterium sp. SC-1]|uniref:VOC family protein n=1 Tax=Niveibacterium sp. SC-1 TaxID=3135646 RepID=UPI00312042A0
MQLRYTIIYVADVRAALAFYERAFGLATRFVTEGGEFGELETGGTALSFVQFETARASLGGDFRPLNAESLPAGIEIGFTCADVPAAYARAVEAGATPVTPPVQKPWGQLISYVRAPEGTLVEICSSMD